MDAGPPFDKTYTRPPDRWPEDNATTAPLGSGRFTKTYSGHTWLVKHDMASYALLMDFWVDRDVTPEVNYVSVKQQDQNVIQVTWDGLAYGRVCLYRCGEADPYSRTYIQSAPAAEWEFTHDLGTLSVIADCWVDGKLVDPTRIKQTENKVTVSFDYPCSGIVCLLLADPAINPEATINWDQIIGKPSVFPPAPHIHDDPSEVAVAISAYGLRDSAGTVYTFDKFALKMQIGKDICELGTDGKVPWDRLPDDGKLRVSNLSGDFEMVARQLVVDDVNSPLYSDGTNTGSKASIRLKPVVKRIAFGGEVVSSNAVPDDTIEASAGFDMKFIMGSNMRAVITDLHTVTLVSPSLGVRTFDRPGEFLPGERWEVMAPMFDEPGTHIIEPYELLEPGEDHLDDNALHIHGQDDIEDVFIRQGNSQPAELTDDTVHSKTRFDSNHFLWSEERSESYTFQEWYTLCGLSYVLGLQAYVVMDMLGDDYRFHKFEPWVPGYVPAFISAMPMSEAPGPIDLCQGHLYGLFPDDTEQGKIALYFADFDASSHPDWQKACVFFQSTFPEDVTVYDVRFRFSGRYACLYIMSENKLYVWDSQNSLEAPNVLTPPVPMQHFAVWGDAYVSYCYGSYSGQSGYELMLSSGPVYEPGVTFAPSVELMSGTATWLAINDSGEDTGNGLAILEDGRYVYAGMASRGQRKVYNMGKAAYWLRPEFGFVFPIQFAYGTGFTPKKLVIPPGVTLKIAFSMTPSYNIPAMLAIWAGDKFEYYPVQDFPDRAQDLSVLGSLVLYGGQTLYYMIYVEQNDPYARFEFSQWWEFMVADKGMYSPVPYNDPANPEATLQVRAVTGGMVLENMTGRVMTDIRLAVFGGHSTLT